MERVASSLCLPRNLKKIIASTWLLLQEAYPIWLKYCFILIGLLLILLYIDFNISCLFFGVDLLELLTHPYTLLACLAWLQTYFTLFLAFRPSKTPKNWHYFKHYLFHRWNAYVLLWFLVIPYLWKLVWLLKSTILAHGMLLIPGTPWHIAPYDVITQLILIILTVTSQFYILFLLDSDASVTDVIKSLKSAFKMALYNLPFCMLMTALLFSLFMLLFLPRLLLFSWLYDQSNT